MKIGIDISQLTYQNTGVGNYLKNLIEHLIRLDNKNQYILFFSSFRGSIPKLDLDENFCSRFSIKKFPFPPKLLNLLWNRLHIAPIEWFIGDVDIFMTSDWTEPPSRKAKKITILYDLVVYTSPAETEKNILNTQKRRLFWVKKESKKILCISNATKNDALRILGIDKKRLEVIYPGI